MPQVRAITGPLDILSALIAHLIKQLPVFVLLSEESNTCEKQQQCL